MVPWDFFPLPSSYLLFIERQRTVLFVPFQSLRSNSSEQFFTAFIGLCTEKCMNLAIIVAEGLDRSNPSEETICDIKVCAQYTTLQRVHDSILKVLSLKEDQEYFYCFSRNTELHLPFFSTFEQLGAVCGDSIILDARNHKKRKINSCLQPTKEDKHGKESVILELVCTTRLIEADGNPFRKVRVVVQSHHNTSYLMHDISNLWGKSGLKFKCGRNVLSADKSYAELGVENESEIVITGGRG